MMPRVSVTLEVHKSINHDRINQETRVLLKQLGGQRGRRGSPGHDRVRQRLIKEARLAARQDTECVQCGATFSPPRGDARYCSSGCRQKAYRARVKQPKPGTVAGLGRDTDLS